MELLELCFHRIKALALIERALEEEPEPTSIKRLSWPQKLSRLPTKRPSKSKIDPYETSARHKPLSQLCNNASLDRNIVNKL